MASAAEIADELAKYSFYHCIDLGNGVVTPGLTDLIPLQQPVIDELRRLPLQGKSVLDIGCRDGLFAFEAEKQGAEVLGIDNEVSLAATELLIPLLGSRVRMQEVNLYDFSVDADARFDVVICAGVLYHLRFPFFGLKRIVDVLKPGGTLILETALLLSMAEHPLLYYPPATGRHEDPSSVTYFNHRAILETLTDFDMEATECRAIVSPSAGWPRFDSWEAFLAGPDGSFADSQNVVHGRATYVSRRSTGRSKDRPSWVDDYWYGTHKIHADIGHA